MITRSGSNENKEKEEPEFAHGTREKGDRMRRTLLFGERIIPGFSIPNAFPSYFPWSYFNEAFALCQKGKRSNFL